MGLKEFLFTIVQQAVNEVITKEVNTRIDRIETRITDVEKNLNQRITDVEKSLNQRITDVEKSLIERFEARFDSIEKGLAGLQGNLEGETRFFHIADYLKKDHSG